MYDMNNLKGNNIIIGSKINGDVINSNEEFKPSWDELKKDIEVLSAEYKDKYSNAEDLALIEEAEQCIRNKNLNDLKKCLSKFTPMLKGFVQNLGITVLANILYKSIGF